MKRAVAINGSPRRGGIVSQALDTACDAARRAGFTVERFDLFDMHITPCRGCMRCRPEAGCALPEDDAHRLCEAIRRADLIVIATPTYWANMPGMLKTAFDRLVTTFMGESPAGLPQPRLKGRRAIVIAACSAPRLFDMLTGESRGAIRAVGRILRTGGIRTRSLSIAGTRRFDGRLPERSGRRICSLTEAVCAKIRK